MANKVVCSSSTVVLMWAAPASANKYTLQVSSKPDFSGTLIVNDDTLTSPTKSFTDTGADDSKRWWRWRYSTNGGTTWSAWQVVGSYWRRNSGSDVEYSVDGWYFIADSAQTDKFLLTPFPMWKISASKIDRARARNRAGDLLSEYLTVKESVELEFPESTYCEPIMVAEAKRFDEVEKTFFLACFRRYKLTSTREDQVVPQIWRGQFSAPPEFSLHSPGQYIMVGALSFEEA